MSFIAARLSRLLSLVWVSEPDGDDPGGRRRKHGILGENKAVSLLRGQGCKILLRNYTTRWGEIDIICRDKSGEEDVLVFVEVKARGETSWESPAEAVTPAKQRRLIHAAQVYLGELDCETPPVRFDVVEVFLGKEAPRCRRIRDAFQLPERSS